MSTTVISAPRRVPASTAVQKRHRLWIVLGAAAAAALILALAVNGAGYYMLSSAGRVFSPRHAELKPGGTRGIALGIAGTVMLLMIYLYPLRKRWKWLSKKGKTKRWLDYHILMGLTAPVIITFHASFKFRGAAGLAYWSMMAVVVSGIIGRYFYARIPRKVGEVEMSLGEAERLRADLALQISGQQFLSTKQVQALLALPSGEAVKSMPLLKALAVIVALDVRRAYMSWRLRLHASQELKHALAAANRQARLSKDLLFYSKMKRIFRAWHTIHRPFSYALAILAVMHIVVVTLLGYF